MNKKRLMTIFSIILCLILMSKVLGKEIETSSIKYGVTSVNVNLRRSANVSESNVIKVLKKGTNVKIIASKDDFYAVELNNSEVGFVYKKYVKIIDKITIGNTFYILTPTSYEATSNVNIRKGPSTSFGKIASISKGKPVTVFGKINDFYIVIYDNNKIGCISSKYLSKSYTNVDDNPLNLSKRDLVIYYINEERKKAGLSSLNDSSDLNRLATLKAEDMVKNNYFSHTSKTYGSPFEMLKNYGITYNYAGENIAGNTSMKKAVEKWMASEYHKKNILSKNYTKIGAGVIKSEKYGYIIVTLFTN